MRRELLEALKQENYSKDTKDYLNELINLKYSPFRDMSMLDSLDLTPLEREILKYNLTIKAINAIGDNLPENSKMKVNKFDRFSIDVAANSEWPIVKMVFDENIKVSYYDRTDLLKKIFDLSNELGELEEDYHHNYSVYYNHLDATEAEVNMKFRIEELKNKIYDLSLLKEDRRLFVLDEILRNELRLPSDPIKKVKEDEIYETYKVTKDSNIKVYKKVIGK